MADLSNSSAGVAPRLSSSLSNIHLFRARLPRKMGGNKGRRAHGRRNATPAETDAGDQAFLGGNRGRRAAPAKLQRLPPDLLSAPAVLPEVRLAQRLGRQASSGKAKLYSYVIHHRPAPGFTPPYAIAVVELDEGPRMMTNIVGCPQTPEALMLDMPLRGHIREADRRDLPALLQAGRQPVSRGRHETRNDRRRRRSRDHRARRHSRHVADPAACRCGPQCHGGLPA